MAPAPDGAPFLTSIHVKQDRTGVVEASRRPGGRLAGPDPLGAPPFVGGGRLGSWLGDGPSVLYAWPTTATPWTCSWSRSSWVSIFF